MLSGSQVIGERWGTNVLFQEDYGSDIAMGELIEYILLSLLLFLLDFWITHGLIAVEVMEKLSPSARRKRKRNQNFWDWLFFRRYRGIISQKKLIRHYFGWAIFIIILILQFIADRFNWNRSNVLMLHLIITAVLYVPLGIEHIFLGKRFDE